MCTSSVLPLINTLSDWELCAHLCSSWPWFLLSGLYKMSIYLHNVKGLFTNSECWNDLRLCWSVYTFIHQSIHPSMPVAILSSVKSNVNLCFPFMLTSKMRHTHKCRCTIHHILVNARAPPHTHTCTSARAHTHTLCVSPLLISLWWVAILLVWHWLHAASILSGSQSQDNEADLDLASLLSIRRRPLQ